MRRYRRHVAWASCSVMHPEGRARTAVRCPPSLRILGAPGGNIRPRWGIANLFSRWQSLQRHEDWAIAVGALGRGALVVAVSVAAGVALGLNLRGSSAAKPISAATTTVQVVGTRGAGAHPAAIPTLLEGARDPQDLILSQAIPTDATLDSAHYVSESPQQLIVTWDRSHFTPNGMAAIWQRRGMAIWERDPGSATTWHHAYTFENQIKNDQDTVDGFEVRTGDISGDGRPEVLIRFSGDGSSGPGTYHLFVSDGRQLRQPLIKGLPDDAGTIAFVPGALRVTEGVDAHFNTSPHCCFRKVRTTVMRWLKGHLVSIQRSVGPNRRGWPPG
jgi:hypothetical protein